MFNRHILTNITHASIGEILARIPVLLAQLFIAKQFGPLLFGVWSLAQLIVNFNFLFGFGIISGYEKNEPILIGQGNASEAAIMRNTSFTTLFLISVVIFVICCFFAFLPLSLPLSSLDIVLLGAIVIVQQIYSYFQTQYQNHQLFLDLSYGKCIYSLSYLFLVVALVHYKNTALIIIAWGLSYFFSSVFYFFRQHLLSPKLTIDKKMLIDLYSSGFLIYLGGLGKLLMTSIDRVLVGVLLGTIALGFYNTATVFVTIILTLYTIVPKVMYPHMLNNCSKDSNSKIVEDFSLGMKQLSVMLDPLLCVVPLVYFLVITIYLPSYSPGLYPGLFLIFAGYLFGKTNMLFMILPVIDKSKAMFVCTIVCLLLLILSFYLFSLYSKPTILMFSIIVDLTWLIFVCMLSWVVFDARKSFVAFMVKLINIILLPILCSFLISLLLILLMNHLPTIERVLFAIIYSGIAAWFTFTVTKRLIVNSTKSGTIV